MHLVSSPRVESGVRERHGPTSERRATCRCIGVVMQRGRHSLNRNVDKPGGLEGLPQSVARAQLKEERADVRRDPPVDNRKNLRPATLRASAPHRDRHPARGAQEPMHLSQRPNGVNHVHEAEGAQRDVERPAL